MNVDTLSIARELRAADLPPEQAEAIAAAIGRAVAESSATKSDLDLARAGLEAKVEQGRVGLDARITQLDRKIDQVKAELEVRIEQVRTELERTRNQIILWVITSQVTLAGIIIAVIKL